METRYLVFAGDDYYPVGGAKDFIRAFDDPSAAALGMPRNRDWAHVAELSRHGLVVIAELRDGNLSVYPERMAHQRAVST